MITSLPPPPPPSLPGAHVLIISLTLVKTPDKITLSVSKIRCWIISHSLSVFILSTFYSLVQRISVSTLASVSLPSLPHSLVGPVVQNQTISVTQFVFSCHVIMIQSFQHIGVDPPGVLRGVVLYVDRSDVVVVVVRHHLHLAGLGLAGPAVEGVGQRDPVHGDLDPVGLGDDGVRDAGRREHRGHRLQRPPDVAALVVDEVPLGLGHRGPDIVRRHLGLVKLPLEDEHRS